MISYSIACARILNHFGIEAQKLKLQEECAELIRAIARKDEENMIEEIADVSLLIDQFRIYNRNIGKIEEIKFAKAERTLKRISEKRKDNEE